MGHVALERAQTQVFGELFARLEEAGCCRLAAFGYDYRDGVDHGRNVAYGNLRTASAHDDVDLVELPCPTRTTAAVILMRRTSVRWSNSSAGTRSSICTGRTARSDSRCRTANRYRMTPMATC